MTAKTYKMGKAAGAKGKSYSTANEKDKAGMATKYRNREQENISSHTEDAEGLKRGALESATSSVLNLI